MAIEIEDALDELNVIYERLSHPENCEQGVYSFRDGNYLEALDLAIESLESQEENIHREKEQAYMQGYEDASKKYREAEPCEDCISREAAIKVFGGVHPMDYNTQAYITNIQDLPSVQPEPFINKPCVSEGACEHDKQSVIAKIKAEIEQKAKIEEVGGRGIGKSIRYGLCIALEIIDKYKAEIKAESEE